MMATEGAVPANFYAMVQMVTPPPAHSRGATR